MFSPLTCAWALFMSSLVRQVKFCGGMEEAKVRQVRAFVLAGFPTTTTYEKEGGREREVKVNNLLTQQSHGVALVYEYELHVLISKSPSST